MGIFSMRKAVLYAKRWIRWYSQCKSTKGRHLASGPSKVVPGIPLVVGCEVEQCGLGQ